jgi:hypothetical protein
MSNIPTRIVFKIILDAMQLRNLELCEEIRRNVAIYKLANQLFGFNSFKIREFITAAEEIYIGHAPITDHYNKHKDWLADYKKWHKDNPGFIYRQKWPKIS